MTQPTKREQLAAMRLEDFKAHLRAIARRILKRTQQQAAEPVAGAQSQESSASTEAEGGAEHHGTRNHALNRSLACLRCDCGNHLGITSKKKFLRGFHEFLSLHSLMAWLTLASKQRQIGVIMLAENKEADFIYERTFCRGDLMSKAVHPAPRLCELVLPLGDTRNLASLAAKPTCRPLGDLFSAHKPVPLVRRNCQMRALNSLSGTKALRVILPMKNPFTQQIVPGGNRTRI